MLGGQSVIQRSLKEVLPEKCRYEVGVCSKVVCPMRCHRKLLGELVCCMSKVTRLPDRGKV